MDHHMRRRLFAYLDSPYFTIRPGSIELANELQSRLNEAQLDPHDIWHSLYPMEAFNHSAYRLLNSYLYKSCREFLALESIRQLPGAMDRYAAQTLYELNMVSESRRLSRGALDRLRKNRNQQSGRLYQVYRMERDVYDFELRSNSIDQNATEEFVRINEYLDQFFIVEKIRQACLTINAYKLSNTALDIRLVNDVLEEVRHDDSLRKEPLIAIYFTVYNFLSENEPLYHFRALLGLLHENSELFAPIELTEIYTLAVNFGISRVNTGLSEYTRITLDLIRNGITDQTLLPGGNISPSTFTNTVRLACESEEFIWTEEFIAEFEGKLPKENRENILHLGRATLFYHQGKPDEAQHELAQLDGHNKPRIYMSAQLLLLRILFQNKEINSIDSLLSNLKNYLNRHTDLGYSRDIYRAIVLICRQITRLAPGDAKGQQRILKKIDHENFPAHIREWLYSLL